LAAASRAEGANGAALSKRGVQLQVNPAVSVTLSRLSRRFAGLDKLTRKAGGTFAMTGVSLYDRLGGAKGIALIVDDVMAAHLKNPLVRTRFENVKDLDHAKKLAREFFCAGCGGPETYSGRDMITAHKGMNISEQEYLAVMDDIVAALAKNKVGEDAVTDVIAILYSLKGQIIRV
jgi:hemoglobin